MNKRVNTWLRLLRAPNLFTVPGDPLAGFLLASGGALSGGVFLTMAASLFFYMSGLLLNDVFDLEEDRRERPGRPLPSGDAGKGVVTAVGLLFGMLGLGVCALAGSAALQAGLCVVLCVVIYNGALKKFPGIGAINMGMCRGFSVLVGGAAASHALFRNTAVPAAILVTLYIAAVTNLARNEMSEKRDPLDHWLPCLPLLLGGALLLHRPTLFGALLLLAGGVAAGWIAYRLRDRAVPVPPSIGAFIRLLLLLQAAFCMMVPGGAIPALTLLALWPMSRAFGRRFAGS